MTKLCLLVRQVSPHPKSSWDGFLTVWMLYDKEYKEWIKHREDGPAWNTPWEVHYYVNGKLIK